MFEHQEEVAVQKILIITVLVAACGESAEPPGVVSPPEDISEEKRDAPTKPDTASCTPQCAGKECGDDGCGGSCGTCGADYTCNVYSTCSAATYVCNDHNECTADVWGGRDMDAQKTCTHIAAFPGCCSDNGHCPGKKVCNKPTFTCVDADPNCVPQCLKADGTPKECGADLCGSHCGPSQGECYDKELKLLGTCKGGTCYYPPAPCK